MEKNFNITLKYASRLSKKIKLKGNMKDLAKTIDKIIKTEELSFYNFKRLEL